MSTTVILQVSDALGWGRWTAPTSTGRDVGVQAAAEFDTIQALPIPVLYGHGGPQIGTLLHLERGFEGNGDLVGVGVLDVEPEQVVEMRCSAEVVGHYGRDMLIAHRIRLDAVALVSRTAGVGARAVRVYPGDYRSAAARSCWKWEVRSAGVITRAVEHRHANSARHITIASPPPPTPAGQRWTLVR